MWQKADIRGPHKDALLLEGKAEHCSVCAVYSETVIYMEVQCRYFLFSES